MLEQMTVNGMAMAWIVEDVVTSLNSGIPVIMWDSLYLFFLPQGNKTLWSLQNANFRPENTGYTGKVI